MTQISSIRLRLKAQLLLTVSGQSSKIELEFLRNLKQPLDIATDHQLKHSLTILLHTLKQELQLYNLLNLLRSVRIRESIQ